LNTAPRFHAHIYPDEKGCLPALETQALESGALQVQCQNALRYYMLAGFSADMTQDAPNPSMTLQGRLSILPPYSFQAALALTIPAPDYDLLLQFAESQMPDPKAIASWMPNIPGHERIDWYGIYAGSTVDFSRLEDLFKVKPRQVANRAVDLDDIKTAQRLIADTEDAFSFQKSGAHLIESALAQTPFRPSKIRNMLSPEQPISLSELDLRVRQQFDVFSSATLGDDERWPVDDQSSIIRNPDFNVRTLPRYAQYLREFKSEFASFFFLGIKEISRRNAAQADAEPVIKRLFNDLMGSEEHHARTYLRHVTRKRKAWMMDQTPEALYNLYLRHALNDQRKTQPGEKFISSLFLKREPVKSILAACVDAIDIRAAYDATGNVFFIQHLPEGARADVLSTDLGL
jgi:hypothetical protein